MTEAESDFKIYVKKPGLSCEKQTIARREAQVTLFHYRTLLGLQYNHLDVKSRNHD